MFHCSRNFKKNGIRSTKLNTSLGIQDSIVKKTLSNISCEIIGFCKNKLKEYIVRGDYKELLKLTLIFLGDSSDSGNITFRRPGAMHHARFMS